MVEKTKLVGQTYQKADHADGPTASEQAVVGDYRDSQRNCTRKQCKCIKVWRKMCKCLAARPQYLPEPTSSSTFMWLSALTFCVGLRFIGGAPMHINTRIILPVNVHHSKRGSTARSISSFEFRTVDASCELCSPSPSVWCGVAPLYDLRTRYMPATSCHSVPLPCPRRSVIHLSVYLWACPTVSLAPPPPLLCLPLSLQISESICLFVVWLSVSACPCIGFSLRKKVCMGNYRLNSVCPRSPRGRRCFRLAKVCQADLFSISQLLSIYS